MGGGTNQSVLDKIAALESMTSSLSDNIHSLESTLGSLRDEIQRIISMRATESAYGMAKISNATTATGDNGMVVSAKQLNPSIGGTLANELQSLKSRTGNIVFGTVAGEVGGKNYIETKVKSKDVAHGSMVAVNGDSAAWGGTVIGVNCYHEYVRFYLSEEKQGAVRVNYVYVKN